MPACHLGTGFGFHRLEARLGPFMAGPPVAPEELDAHAQARRGYCDARKRRRDAISRLTRSQQAERDRLTQAVTSLPRRVARAFRSVLRQDHQTARAQMRAEIPLPRLRDYGLTPAQRNIPHPPCDTAPWRYSLRAAQAQAAGDLALAAPPDHTNLRQAWALSALSGTRRIPAEADTLRRTPDGQLLIARRNGAGSIVGFDRLMEVDGRPVAWTVSGAALGLARIGPADAHTCVVASDTLSGSVLAARFPRQADRDYRIDALPVDGTAAARDLR